MTSVSQAFDVFVQHHVKGDSGRPTKSELEYAPFLYSKSLIMRDLAVNVGLFSVRPGTLIHILAMILMFFPARPGSQIH
jgi:hypothetical protein